MRLAPVREQLVGDLDQDPRAVAGVVLAAAGAAMVQVHQRRQAVADQLVGFPPLQVDDEPHAATVVLVLRVVETLGVGKPVPMAIVLPGPIRRTRKG